LVAPYQSFGFSYRIFENFKMQREGHDSSKEDSNKGRSWAIETYLRFLPNLKGSRELIDCVHEGVLILFGLFLTFYTILVKSFIPFAIATPQKLETRRFVGPL
jgi:hypothetical protein